MNKLVLFGVIAMLSFLTVTTSSCNKAKTAKLTVTVNLEGLNQKSGIDVSIEDASGNEIDGGETDSDGEYVFEDLLAGTYRVRGRYYITSTQVFTGNQTIQLAEKDKEKMNLTLTDD